MKNMQTYMIYDLSKIEMRKRDTFYIPGYKTDYRSIQQKYLFEIMWLQKYKIVTPM
jgi:hypothetical protein